VSEQVTWLKVGSPNLRFAGAEGEEQRARERHRPVRTVLPGRAVSKRQPQCMIVKKIFSGGVGSIATGYVRASRP